MQKIASHNGTLMSLVLLEEKLASVNDLQVWECSCGAKFMTVYYASFHCEKQHKGETFEDRICLRKELPTDTKLWNTFYSSVSEIITKTISQEEAAKNESQLENDEKSDEVCNKDTVVNREKRKSSCESSTDIVVRKSQKVPTVKCSQISDSESAGVIQTNTAKQNTENKDDSESPSSLSNSIKPSSKVVPPSINQKHIPTKAALLPTPAFPVFVRIPQLPSPIPDPETYQYPHFGLIYDPSLLFLPNGTATVFHWQIREFYFTEVQKNNLKPSVARELWMQNNGHNNQVNYNLG